MALATKCPHCQTTFRVVHDQLKLRAGLVRCGYCKEIFNGIEHLLPPTPNDASESSAVLPTQIQNAPPTPAVTPRVTPSVTPTAALTTAATVATSAPKSITISESLEPQQVVQNIAPAAFYQPDPVAPDASFAVDATQNPIADSIFISSDQVIYSPHDDDSNNGPDSNKDGSNYDNDDVNDTEEVARPDPLQRMTLMDFTHELPDDFDSDAGDTTSQGIRHTEDAADTSLDTQIHDELDAAIEDLQRKPWRKSKKNRHPSVDSISDIDADEDEPAFVRRGRRQQYFGKKLRLFFAIASSLLFITALLQSTYIFRDQIAGMYPPAKPVLIRMCEVLACRIKLPAQIALISIESSELQTLATGKDMFALTTLLRNKSITAQEWPNIELTLNDIDEKPLLRRVFKAADYINTPTDIAQGIAPGNERLVKLTFSLSQIKASGYRVYLFYP